MRVLTLLLVISVVTNLFFAWQFLSGNPSETANQQETQTQFPYLSKRIFSENQNDILINFIPLRTEIKNYIDKQPHPIALYFEYLPSGTSIGVNDNLQIKLASLIKIPLVMAVYKEIEKGTIQEDQVITITKDDIDPLFGTLWKKGEGTQITVHEAITLTLQDSDNTAAHALFTLLPKNAIDEVFDALDLPKIRDDAFPLLSAKGYSSILRSLYLSSYLQKEDSNMILFLLTKTSFSDKLPAGIDKHIPIAHKIGVFNVIETNEEIYSDCGIIYYPQRPYSLCIMVKSDEKQAQSYISHLSKMVFGYIKAVNH